MTLVARSAEPGVEVVARHQYVKWDGYWATHPGFPNKDGYTDRRGTQSQGGR